MAKFAKAWKYRTRMMDLLVQKASEANSASVMEYNAAVRIQSWFRGCRVRAYLAHLHASARIIQGNFRGHLGREEYRRRLEKSLDDMRFGYYQEMAIKIQRCWRGYYVRKFIFDYRAYKEYLKGVMIVNEITRARIKEESERAELEKIRRQAQTNELLEQDQARRHHYLLGTYTREGIFKPDPGRKSHPFEERMRSIHFAPPPLIGRGTISTGLSKKTTKSSECKYSAATTPPPTTQPRPSTEPTLPPLVRVQGPFKSPEEVKRWRDKPFKPTLRVDTPYNAQDLRRIELRDEEWKNRVIDDKFLPFTRQPHPPYEPLLHTSSSYHGRPHAALVTEQYRKSYPHKNISSKPFRTVIRTIATFDELRSSY